MKASLYGKSPVAFAVAAALAIPAPAAFLRALTGSGIDMLVAEARAKPIGQ